MDSQIEKDMIYLVTGATGFLGGEVCRQLLAEQKKVRALVLPKDPAEKYISPEVEIMKGDLCDIDSLKRFFTVSEGYESIVVHCASMVAMGTEHNQKVMEVNVTGTQNIIDQCLSHTECKKLIYVGSTAAIPEKPKGISIREVAYYDETKIYGFYGVTKALACQKVLDAVQQHGLNGCIVLPSGILGPGDYAVGETTSGAIQMLKGGAPVSLNGTFNLCDVRDLAQGILAAIEKGQAGESYILGNEVVSNKAFTRLMAKEGNTKPAKIYLPGWLAMLLADVFEKLAKKKGDRAFLTRYLVYNLTRNNHYDSTKARQKLGYHTRPFTETVHDEVQWLKQNGFV